MLQATEVTEPGVYLYHDPIGSPPEPVTVRRSGGDLVAFLTDLEGDDEVPEILVSDMSGEFEPAPK